MPALTVPLFYSFVKTGLYSFPETLTQLITKYVKTKMKEKPS